MEFKLTIENGLVFDLYHFIWLQDPIFKTVPKINIPQIIQFRAGQARFWYFSIKGQILRKGKEKLDPDYLKYHFIKEESSKIACLWIYQLKDNVQFKYLSQTELNIFMEQIDYTYNGYLQEFIYPKGNNNSVIKCQWQENNCLYETFTNVNNIHNNQLSINQRVTTFETTFGPTINQSLKSKIIAQQLEGISSTIVNHIFNSSYSKIQVTYLETYFKQDEKGELYLMFCTNVKSKQSIKQILKQQQQQQQQQQIRNIAFKLSQPLSTGPNRKQVTLQKCVGCKILLNQNLFEEIKLREIIKSWENNHTIVCNQQPPLVEIDNNCLIPQIIRMIYPKMSFAEFVEKKSSIPFTSITIQICLTCYMKIQKNAQEYNRVQQYQSKQSLTQTNQLFFQTQSIIRNKSNKSKQSNDSIDALKRSSQFQLFTNSKRRCSSQASLLYRTRCATYISQSISNLVLTKENKTLF